MIEFDFDRLVEALREAKRKKEAQKTVETVEPLTPPPAQAAPLPAEGAPQSAGEAVEASTDTPPPETEDALDPETERSLRLLGLLIQVFAARPVSFTPKNDRIAEAWVRMNREARKAAPTPPKATGQRASRVPPPPEANPWAVIQERLEALVKRLEGLGRRGPLLLEVWADGEELTRTAFHGAYRATLEGTLAWLLRKPAPKRAELWGVWKGGRRQLLAWAGEPEPPSRPKEERKPEEAQTPAKPKRRLTKRPPEWRGEVPGLLALEALLEEVQRTGRPQELSLKGGLIRVYPTREEWLEELENSKGEAATFYAEELRRALPVMPPDALAQLLAFKLVFGVELKNPNLQPTPEVEAGPGPQDGTPAPVERGEEGPTPEPPASRPQEGLEAEDLPF